MFASAQAVTILSGVKADEEIEAIVAGVNSKIERRLSRVVLTSEITDRFDVSHSSRKLFYLSAYPVEMVSDVRVSGESITDYKVDYRRGRLTVGVSLPQGIDVVEIDYVGGMADTPEKLREKYPELTYEANKQVVFEYKRMKNIASKSSALSEAVTEVFEPFEMRKELVAAIDVVRRKVFVV